MRTEFLGLRLDTFSFSESVDKCELLAEIRGAQHVVLNAGKVVSAMTDAHLRNSINNSSIVNADGQSIVWAARLLGIKIPERVAGIDLFVELCSRAARNGRTVFLLGATQQVVEFVAHKLESEGVKIIGFRNGFWPNSDTLEVVNEIALLSPDYLFIAMPSPAKEHFVDEYLSKLNAGLTFGVGGSFDVLAGVTRRAPLFLQKIGFEWFYRLIQEPRRMFRRYLVGNSKFIAIVLKEWVFKNFSRD